MNDIARWLDQRIRQEKRRVRECFGLACFDSRMRLWDAQRELHLQRRASR